MSDAYGGDVTLNCGEKQAAKPVYFKITGDTTAVKKATSRILSGVRTCRAGGENRCKADYNIMRCADREDDCGVCVKSGIDELEELKIISWHLGGDERCDVRYP